MFGLNKLSAAIANLANSLNALAGVVDVATGRLRQTLALDLVEVLEHESMPGPAEGIPEGNGRKGRKVAAV
jgi:hypothetical protein